MLSKVLKTNIFEFNRELYLQKMGTAMGTRAAPTYANIFMEAIDSIYKLHPTIKFTHSYDPETKSTTFLDTTIQIKKR